MFWSTGKCTNNWCSAAEDTIIYSHYKNGRLKLPCSEARNRMPAPVIGPFLLHLAYAVWIEATRLGKVCRWTTATMEFNVVNGIRPIPASIAPTLHSGPWLVLGTNAMLYPRVLWCDVNGSLLIFSLQIGEIIHDSHVLVAKTGDEETVKSYGPCDRALGQVSSVLLKSYCLQDQCDRSG